MLWQLSFRNTYQRVGLTCPVDPIRLSIRIIGPEKEQFWAAVRIL
jgi:hypothetical protein